MSAKASDLFVKCLEIEGVERIFGIPGEENLDMLESLRDSPIELVLTRHEQAAGFMAATYGRLTGHAGVCLSTLGPGATNFVTAAAYAQLGAMPMLMITGQKPIKSSKQGQFQIIDVINMMQPLTKFTRQIASGTRIPSTLREAFRTAEEERPGAAHIELPEDVADEQVDLPPLEKSIVRRPVAEPKAIHRAVDQIAAAKRPLVLIGAGANRTLASSALRIFIDNFQIPFVTTQMGKGVVSDNHPMAIGTCSLSDHDFVHRAIEHADLIINVGHDVVEKPPFFMQPGGTAVIHINYTSAEVDPVYFPQVELVGDIAATIATLGSQLSRPDHWDISAFKKIQEALRADIDGELGDDVPDADPRRIVRQVREVMPDDGILALDNGMYKIWFARNYPARWPNTVLLDNALATMGAGLPSAMAAKIVYPKRRVLSICGDGGFMMNSAELETAVRLQQDLVVLLLRDDAFGMIRWKQASDNFPDYGLQFSNPDFVKYAESYGAHGHRVVDASKLAETLEAAFSAGGVHLVEAPIDYSQNDQLLNQDIPAKAAALTID